MTFPVVEDVIGYSSTGFISNHEYDYPNTVNAGDLLLQFHKADADPATNLDLGEMTELLNEVYTETASRRMIVGGKIAVGDEGGGSNSFTHDDNRRAAGFMVRISGWSGDLNDIAFTSPVSAGSSASIDADTVTAPWGGGDNLFCWFAGWQNDGETVSSWPSNFPDNQTFEDNGGGVDASITAAFASTESSSDSIDPAAATITGSEAWGAIGIAIRSSSEPATDPGPFATNTHMLERIMLVGY